MGRWGNQADEAANTIDATHVSEMGKDVKEVWTGMNTTRIHEGTLRSVIRDGYAQLSNKHREMQVIRFVLAVESHAASKQVDLCKARTIQTSKSAQSLHPAAEASMSGEADSHAPWEVKGSRKGKGKGKDGESSCKGKSSKDKDKGKGKGGKSKKATEKECDWEGLDTWTRMVTEPRVEAPDLSTDSTGYAFIGIIAFVFSFPLMCALPMILFLPSTFEKVAERSGVADTARGRQALAFLRRFASTISWPLKDHLRPENQYRNS